jgi:SAM-dependent methyltransferase
MLFFKKIGLERIAWSLRRLYCPVESNALVLEVGSGGNPYARANVLLDAYEDTRERHWVPLVTDRPIILGFGERLPFRDKSFDFVIACHVLEHSADPVAFLNELQRVAKAGYIETPDAFMERVNPYRDHRLEVTVRNAELVIRRKRMWVVEPDTVELYENRVKPLLTGELIPRHPFAFHVRYFWKDVIRFRVVNTETDGPMWDPPAERESCRPIVDPWGGLRSFLLNHLRSLFSQTSRNKALNVLGLLRCPTCAGEELLRFQDEIRCPSCGMSYAVRNGIPIMYHRNLLMRRSVIQ